MMREILIISSHFALREVLADILSDAGYTVYTRPTEEAALTFLASSPRALIVIIDYPLSAWATPANVAQALITYPAVLRHFFILFAEQEETLLADLPSTLPLQNQLLRLPFDLPDLLDAIQSADTYLQWQSLVS